jgi:2-keto-4-pentenoate hydratase/2-oxohepta-3-ene-1,7-dioic acid hydratase in catechol pathway
MKIFCIGRNYEDHAKELNNKVPTEPMVFMKPATALVKDGSPFYLPDFSNDVHYEVEIVLRIGKNGKQIQESFALEYINAITIGIDFTARDIQNKCKDKGHPWEIAKAFDHSAPIGKWVDFEPFKNKQIKFGLKKNGNTVQQGDSNDLIFSFEVLISHLSKFFTLQQGDMIFTGTPAGVGKVMIGDHLEGYLFDDKLLECRVK